MSYGLSAALQTALFGALEADAELTSMVGTAVFDTMPTGTTPDMFVALGPEDVVEQADGTSPGANHDLQVTVVTTGTGFLGAKQVAGRVSDILTNEDLSLSRGNLVQLRFRKAKARRDTTDGSRRIDMWFRARVTDDI